MAPVNQAALPASKGQEPQSLATLQSPLAPSICRDTLTPPPDHPPLPVLKARVPQQWGDGGSARFTPSRAEVLVCAKGGDGHLRVRAAAAGGRRGAGEGARGDET